MNNNIPLSIHVYKTDGKYNIEFPHKTDVGTGITYASEEKFDDALTWIKSYAKKIHANLSNYSLVIEGEKDVNK